MLTELFRLRRKLTVSADRTVCFGIRTCNFWTQFNPNELQALLHSKSSHIWQHLSTATVSHRTVRAMPGLHTAHRDTERPPFKYLSLDSEEPQKRFNKGMKWRSTATTTSTPSRFLTRYCNCGTTIFCFTERHWNVANKDPNRQWLSVKSNFSRVTEITSTMERSQLSLSGKTKRYRKYTLILSFIAFSTTIYGLAIETECKSNPLPPAIFYLAFETLLLVYDRKRFVCSFFLSCLQRAALLIAVDKLSVTLYENSLHSDKGKLFYRRQNSQRKGRQIAACWRKLLIKYTEVLYQTKLF